MNKLIKDVTALIIIVGMVITGSMYTLYVLSKNSSDYKCYSTGITYKGKDVDLNDRGYLITPDGVCRNFVAIDRK